MLNKYWCKANRQYRVLVGETIKVVVLGSLSWARSSMVISVFTPTLATLSSSLSRSQNPERNCTSRTTLSAIVAAPVESRNREGRATKWRWKCMEIVCHNLPAQSSFSASNFSLPSPTLKNESWSSFTTFVDNSWDWSLGMKELIIWCGFLLKGKWDRFWRGENRLIQTPASNSWISRWDRILQLSYLQ